jgi:hypothetical protein
MRTCFRHIRTHSPHIGTPFRHRRCTPLGHSPAPWQRPPPPVPSAHPPPRPAARRSATPSSASGTSPKSPCFRRSGPHSSNSTLAALVSGDRQKLKALGNRYGVRHTFTYDKVDRLFRSGEIDAGFIALPNNMHKEYTVRATEAGLHVLCERPLAVTVNECEEMIDATRRNGVKLMTAYRLHFERANLEAAQIAQSGKLGELRYLTGEFSQQVSQGNIRLDDELTGGPVYDMGIYCINAARAVFAAEPTELIAAATHARDARFREVPDTVSVIMKFPKERMATFTCSFGAADRSTYSMWARRTASRFDPAFDFTEGGGTAPGVRLAPQARDISCPCAGASAARGHDLVASTGRSMSRNRCVQAGHLTTGASLDPIESGTAEGLYGPRPGAGCASEAPACAGPGCPR